jgi:hypothetical protein
LRQPVGDGDDGSRFGVDAYQGLVAGGVGAQSDRVRAGLAWRFLADAQPGDRGHDLPRRRAYLVGQGGRGAQVAGQSRGEAVTCRDPRNGLYTHWVPALPERPELGRAAQTRPRLGREGAGIHV